MRFVVDQDYHIHTGLSLCSLDPAQTPARVLQYAVDAGLNDIILTDHHWDETVPKCQPLDFYDRQDYAHIAQSLPLPQKDGIRFRFGCEIDLDKTCTLGMAKEHFDRFAFVIIPTTHLHMDGFTIDVPASFERRAELWVERLDAVLAMDLPFRKIGIAHPTCCLLAGMLAGGVTWQDHIRVLDLLPESTLERQFRRAAELGVGIELNFTLERYTPEELPHILRIYRIAKACGCKFYFGSDAHTPADFLPARDRFERIVDLLELTEDDKFRPAE